MQAKRADLDLNHHVNNVKYVGWMLEVCITANSKFPFVLMPFRNTK